MLTSLIRGLSRSLGRRPARQSTAPVVGAVALDSQISVAPATESASIANQSPHIEQLLVQASNLRHLGKLTDAIVDCEAALRLDPHNAEALWLRGLLSQDAANMHEAERFLREAYTRSPRAEICNDLGVLLLRTGNHLEARGLFAQAVRLQREFVAAHTNLGSALLALGKWRAASACLSEALRLDETFLPARLHRGVARRELGDYTGAIEDFEYGMKLAPEDSDLPANLGAVLRESGFPQRALAVLCQNLCLHPQHVPTLVNLGMVHTDLGQTREALACFAAAINKEPGNASAQFALGLTLLQQGNFSEGWKKYEYRFKTDWYSKDSVPDSNPRWDGRELAAGSRLLITSEQGIGDQIMFASCLPDTMARARECIVECDERLKPLFARSFPTITFTKSAAREVTEHTHRAIAAQIPFGSLPSLWRNSAADFPNSLGYLKPDPDRVLAWATKLAPWRRHKKIGLAWRAGTPRTGAAKRSTQIVDWASLFALPNLLTVSLQHDARKEELAQINELTQGRLLTPPDDDHSPENCASIIANLDLIITVCGTIAHLAGGVGRPVWIATPRFPEWRYGLTGSTWIWYPSARLWRAGEAGWPALADAMSEEFASCLTPELGRAP